MGKDETRCACWDFFASGSRSASSWLLGPQLDRVCSSPGAFCSTGKCSLLCELPVVPVVPSCCPGSLAIGPEGQSDARQGKDCGHQSEDAHAHGHTERPAQGIDDRLGENRESHAVRVTVRNRARIARPLASIARRSAASWSSLRRRSWPSTSSCTSGGAWRKQPIARG